MNKNFFAPGAIYNDHHKDITINTNGTNTADILRAVLADDVEPVREEKTQQQDLFCRITEAAYNEGKAQYVENDLRSASVSAPKLVKVLRTNEALGYLDTKDLPSTDLYDLLNEHYHLPFKLRTFQDSRAK